MNIDWKAALEGLKDTLPEGKNSPETAEPVEVTAKKKGKLEVILDRKGRKGKEATIVAGFNDEDDAEVERIAGELKRKLGVGGSSRGGEILIQGDKRTRVVELLREMGYGVK